MAGKNRSPNYPWVGLQEALEAARKLYAASGRAALLPDAAILDMGYKSPHGPARAKLSALRKYGLLDKAAGGKLRLSDRAITLIQPGADPHEYRNALQAAAGDPPLFAKYLQTFTPSNDALKLNLIREEGFSASGADQFIRAFRDTQALLQGEAPQYTRANEQGGTVAVEPAVVRSFGGPSGSSVRSVQVPLSATTWATLQAPFPLTEDAWTQMLAVLNAMKPGLVGDPSLATDPEDQLRRSLPPGQSTGVGRP